MLFQPFFHTASEMSEDPWAHAGVQTPCRNHAVALPRWEKIIVGKGVWEGGQPEGKFPVLDRSRSRAYVAGGLIKSKGVKSIRIASCN